MKISLISLVIIGQCLIRFSPAYSLLFIKNVADNKPGTKQLIKKNGVLNFSVMGDWRRNGADNQKQVAEQMGKTAADVKAQLIIATGDNFYQSSVISKHNPLKYSFEHAHTAFSLQMVLVPGVG